MIAVGSVVCLEQVGGRRRAPERDTAFASLGGFNRTHGRQRFAGRNASKSRFDTVREFVGVEIARGHDERVGGAVGAFVVVEEIVTAHGFEIGFFADHHVAVGVRAKRRPDHFFVEEIAGIVLRALAFRKNDRSLGLSFGGIEEGIAHPVRFDLDREIEPIDGQRLVVGGPVVGGHGVVNAAVAGNFGEDRAFAERGRALELHVLDPVRNTGQAGSFVAARPVPDPE